MAARLFFNVVPSNAAQSRSHKTEDTQTEITQLSVKHIRVIILLTNRATFLRNRFLLQNNRNTTFLLTVFLCHVLFYFRVLTRLKSNI
jgi:hypothetical protein